LELRAALFPLGRADEIQTCISEAGRLAKSLDDPVRIARADAQLGNYCWWTGRPDHALAHATRALETFDRLGDRPVALGFHFSVGQAYHALGDYRRAIGPLTDVVDFFSEDRLRWRGPGIGGLVSIFSRTLLASCLDEIGEIASAQARIEDVVGIAERLGHPFSIVYAQAERGRLALSLGDPLAAIPACERALDVGRQARLAIWFPWVAAMLGRAYVLTGRTEEGLSLLEDGIRQAEVTRFMFGQALRVAWLAEACASAGRMAEADEQGGRALRLAREHRERGHEAWTLFTIGAIAAHREPVNMGVAESSYVAASALASDLGMRPLVAHCHLGLGNLLRSANTVADAGEHLEAAITMYREMTMPFWLKKAETAMSDLR
jgi:tetratricopeptide (TPR) repeat protein